MRNRGHFVGKGRRTITRRSGDWLTGALRVLACLACLPVVLTACGSASDDAGAGDARRGGTLTIATAFEPPTLDPTLGEVEVGSANVMPQLFDQLVEVLPDSRTVQPGLAKSWKQSADGLTYTFHLRKARFSNGAPVTSDDVVFSLRRTLDPKIDVNFASTFSFIESVTNPDRSTVVLKLNKSTPAALDFLAFGPPSIIPKAYFQKVGAKRFAEHPVGSGAFKLERWRRGQELVLTRNPYYWRTGLPYVDKAVIRLLPDDNARILALKSGAIDIDDNVPFSQLRALESQSGIEVLEQPVAATFAVVLSQRGQPLLRERALRQALNYATPKSAIVKVVFDGRARIANSVLPPLAHWDSSIPPYSYDVAKAKQLVAQSQSPNGFSLDMNVLAGSDTATQTATILQEAWAKIGVKVAVHQAPASTMFEDLQSGKAGAGIWPATQWASDITTEDEWGTLFLTGAFSTFFGGYENKALNRLMAQATTTRDEQQRRSLWSQVQEDLLQDAPWVPIAFPSVTPAVRSNVQGFKFVPTVWWRLEGVSVR